MFGLMLAIFLGALDQTIVAVSLSAISAQLGDFHLLGWIVSGYMMAMTVATPLYGKLGDLYGRRRLLLASIGLFTLASCLCALARDMQQLILARMLQGLGAGGLITLSQAIIGDLMAPRERGRYQGYISSMFALASVAGPLLGGLLTATLSWRWVFWINLPLGLLAMAISRRALLGLPQPVHPARIDYLGTLLLVAALSVLLLAISRAGEGPAGWHAGELSALFGLAAALLLAFVWQERRAPEPLLPLHLFGQRSLVLSGVVIFVATFQAISLTMLIPLRYQSLTGHGAAEAALHLLPLVMGVPLGAYCSGRLVGLLGRYKPQMLFGSILLPLAMVALALVAPQQAWFSGLCMSLCGVAIGCQYPTCMIATQMAVAPRHMGVATSTANLLRALGGTLGMALMSSLLLVLLQQAGAPVRAIDGDPTAGLAPAQIADAFNQLLLIGAAVALPGVFAALFLPDRRLPAHP
ncbi:MFS transporter [Stutzerimonas kirkiae]|uniref:MFS transporter n=2 Tax=Stutzerimonas kirkiae TaxID=2211392 RepID=A0A4Q9QWL1_9GAMM|nr:MFS transporter [Stutzerimonas kirkiae]TBU98024.1 MFS transporter [Stutzerimonas kirkiae]